MAKVKRANVFLTIPDEDIHKYFAKGYSIVDDYGKVIKQSIPTELSQLQRAYSEHEELIKQKDLEIARLNEEIKALKEAGVKKTPAKESSKVEEDNWDDWAEAEEVDEKPRKKRKKE